MWRERSRGAGGAARGGCRWRSEGFAPARAKPPAPALRGRHSGQSKGDRRHGSALPNLESAQDRDLSLRIASLRNVRDSTGAMHDLHGDTKRILHECGNVLYCDAVLQTSLASAPMRARRQMQAASKLVTTHQNVIVTCRGHALTAADARRVRIRAGN